MQLSIAYIHDFVTTKLQTLSMNIAQPQTNAPNL